MCNQQLVNCSAFRIAFNKFCASSADASRDTNINLHNSLLPNAMKLKRNTCAHHWQHNRPDVVVFGQWNTSSTSNDEPKIFQFFSLLAVRSLVLVFVYVMTGSNVCVCVCPLDPAWMDVHHHHSHVHAMPCSTQANISINLRVRSMNLDTWASVAVHASRMVQTFRIYTWCPDSCIAGLRTAISFVKMLQHFRPFIHLLGRAVERPWKLVRIRGSCGLCSCVFINF